VSTTVEELNRYISTEWTTGVGLPVGDRTSCLVATSGGPSILLYNECWGIFLRWWSGRGGAWSWPLNLHL